MRTYFVIYRNDIHYQFTVCAGPFATVGEASAARDTSGDLVVDQTYMPVIDDDWLWPWEKVAVSCYAQRMIASARAGLFKVGRQIPRLSRIA